jgi:hypothetical protein
MFLKGHPWPIYASNCTRKTVTVMQVFNFRNKMLVKLCKYSAHKNSILLGVGHWPVNGLCMCVAHTNSSSTCQKQKKTSCINMALKFVWLTFQVCVMCDTHCFCWYFCLSNFRWTNCIYLECSANLIFMSFPCIISLAYCFLDFNDNEKVNQDEVVVCSHLVPIRIFFSAYSLR